LAVRLETVGFEHPNQGIRDSDDVEARVASLSPIPHLPAQAEVPGEVVGEDRVVKLRQRHDCSVHRPTIQGAPSPVMGSLHLVATTTWVCNCGSDDLES
jgi:hypothetical protein